MRSFGAVSVGGPPPHWGWASRIPRAVVLVQGDGGHQLTANQIGTMGHYGINPIIVLLNNGIFGIEEIVMGNNDPAKISNYDRLPNGNTSFPKQWAVAIGFVSASRPTPNLMRR